MTFCKRAMRCADYVTRLERRQALPSLLYAAKAIPGTRQSKGHECTPHQEPRKTCWFTAIQLHVGTIRATECAAVVFIQGDAMDSGLHRPAHFRNHQKRIFCQCKKASRFFADRGIEFNA